MMVISLLFSAVFALGAARVASANTPATGCSLLTSAQIQKVLDQPFDAPKQTKLLPPFSNQWGSHCTYTSQRGGDAVVDFWVYVTASAAQAKQWFDMGAVAAKPKSKPAIGDSAHIDPDNDYIYVPQKQGLLLDFYCSGKRKAREGSGGIRCSANLRKITVDRHIIAHIGARQVGDLDVDNVSPPIETLASEAHAQASERRTQQESMRAMTGSLSSQTAKATQCVWFVWSTPNVRRKSGHLHNEYSCC